MVHVHIHSSCIERKGRPSTEKHAFTFLYDRQQLPVQCEVEVGGDYYYIGPQRAGLPPNLKVRSGIINGVRPTPTPRRARTTPPSRQTKSHVPVYRGPPGPIPPPFLGANGPSLKGGRPSGEGAPRSTTNRDVAHFHSLRPAGHCGLPGCVRIALEGVCHTTEV
jgi:hypothetical protein